MRFAKIVYTVAGVYGLLALVPQYFMEEKTGRDYPPAITHPEYYYGFIGVAVAWQVLFLLMARDPVRLRPAMIPSILEKASFGIAVLVLFMMSRVGLLMLAAGIIDLILGALFAISYAKTAGLKR
ncbi:MAG TPA: hypothetical protein VJS44_03870 [Pyrinomonadaceae bacterium]|nr:hypothetical protein [Pyrinomonadaceae bacterium]